MVLGMERRTKQRDAIQLVFEEADRPLSPEEVFCAAQRLSHGVGVATIYRAIKSMIREKVLHVVKLPGEPARYELAGKVHHHHFRCHACGKVYEANGCPGSFERFVPKGFRLDGHELVLYGRCASCLTGNGHRN